MDDKETAAAWAVYAETWVPTVVLTRDSAGEVEGETIVERTEPSEPFRYEASLPFRQVICEGDTEASAVASLMRSYCEMARAGSFNPHSPFNRGAPTIQHVMSLLMEELGRQLQYRYSDWEHMTQTEEVHDQAVELETPAGGAWTKNPAFARRNEVISGLSTALAALARVKEL